MPIRTHRFDLERYTVAVVIKMITNDFHQIDWDRAVEDDCRKLVRLWVREDLGRGQDWTTVALVSNGGRGRADLVARCDGMLAGSLAVPILLDEMDVSARWNPLVEDGAVVKAGTVLAEIDGAARDLLTVERLLLNVIGHLSGIASLTAQFVAEISGTSVSVYDTRKTLPGWRRLQKYAVRCGGGRNHRRGLDEAILIKDNHLALAVGQTKMSPGDAVRQARQFIQTIDFQRFPAPLIVEVEVDDLEQLQSVLSANPDLVLLDNMTPDQLRNAVALRNSASPNVQLEASGGIQLSNVRTIAETGIDRLSIGALTHSAIQFDVALDWK